MDPWWTDPKTGKPDAQPVGPKTVTVNILPDALPCKPQRRRSSTVVMSKPFQEPPYWLETEETAVPARPAVVRSQPVEEPPFQFAATAAPRKRRVWRSAIGLFVPTFVSVSCAGLIVALTLQAMNPPKRQPESQAVAVMAKPQAAEPPVPVLAKPRAAVVAKAPVPEQPVAVAVEPSEPEPVKPQAAVVESPPALAKPQAAAVEEKPVPAPIPVVVVRAEPAKAPAADCAICKEPGVGPKQDTYGTSIHFVENTKAAGEEAKAQKKLMLVLNISGNFEDSGFT